MFISKLKMSGFKSFADETNVTLESGLNGIIGPNGSGKSNILEAIKWVMGESSSKNLRGSGMNDVIFNGSASKPSKNIAQVVLTIDVNEKDLSKNNKRFVKSGVVEVERQILRDAGSTYRINGKEVKAKEIQFLFADFSSGSRASNIIDQGSVGNLVTQKPLERRKILDESAGISGITARKIESTNKLEATKKNLQRLSDILSSQKERLAELKKQADKAKSFKLNKKKITELIKDVSVAKLSKSRKQLENLKRTYLDNKSQLNEIRKSTANVSNELILAKNELKKIENEEKKLKETNLVSELKIEKIGYEISNNEKELLSLKNLEEQIDKNISFQIDILENSESRIKKLKDKQKEFLNIKSIENADLIKNNLNKSQNSLQKQQEILSDLNNNLTLKKETITRLNYELETKEKKVEQICEEVNSIKRSLKNISKEKKVNFVYNDLFKNKESLEVTKEEITKVIEKDNNFFNDTKSSLDKLSNDILKLNHEESALKDKINKLEKEFSSVSSLGFQNKSDNILKYVSIKKGYELAFYLAIGDGIEACKENNAENPVIWRSPKNIKMPDLPNNLKSLSNYVKAPIELKNFLSQVAVVISNEQGNKISNVLKNGQLAVTTSGSLWRWDGLHIKEGKKTITYKRITSTTRLLELDKEIKNQNIILNRIINEKVKIQKIFNKNQSLFEELIKKIETNQKRVEEIKFELNSIENKLFLNKSTLEKEKDELIEKNNLLKNKNEEYKTLKVDIKDLKSKISVNSREIIDTKNIFFLEEKKIKEIRLNLDKQQIDFAVCKQKQDAEKLNIRKVLLEIKDTEYQINKTNSTIANLNENLKKVSKNIINNKSRPKDYSAKISSIKDAVNNNNKIIEELKNTFKKKSEIVNSLDKKLSIQNEKIKNLTEITIRKEIQQEEINNFISYEVNRIKEDLEIKSEEIEKLVVENANKEIDIKETESLIKKLKFKNELIGNVNLYAEEELSNLESKVKDIIIEEKDLINAAKKLEKAIEELNKEARKRVKETFVKMNSTFSKLFKQLFGGGKAYLEMVDSDDPLQAGLELMVSPPGKKLQRLSLLSGGEKALASLALIFTTFINKVTPICILDEVDAPLDDANVEKFNRLLKEVSTASEKKFLIITHNKITMSNMNKIFGITMMEPGVSKIVSVNVDRQTSVHAAE